MKPKAWGVILVLIALLLGGGYVVNAMQNNRIPATVEKAYRDGYCQVTIARPTLLNFNQKPLPVFAGGGFLINKKKKWVFSGLHVIPDESDIALHTTDGVPDRIFCNGIPAYPLAWSVFGDGVLLQLYGDLPDEFKELKLGKAEPGETVYAKARGNFPLGNTPVTGQLVELPGELIFTGQVQGVAQIESGGQKNGVYAGGPDVQFLWLDRPTRTGFSGGPLFNRKGEVVGIAVKTDFGFSYASSSWNIAHLTEYYRRSAEEIAARDATIYGWINPVTDPTMVWFEWGSTVGLGKATMKRRFGASTLEQEFSAKLDGLAPNTVYYYQVVSQGKGEVERGVLLVFQTRPQ